MESNLLEPGLWLWNWAYRSVTGLMALERADESGTGLQALEPGSWLGDQVYESGTGVITLELE